MKRKALFLDRDGVINENRTNYVRSLDDVVFFPSSLEILKRIALLPYAIIIVTNQSAVGRGIISLEQAHDINQHIIQRVTEVGGRIDGVYLCPHAPDECCDCRKPRPGLLHQAAQEYNIDMSQSVMVGDAYTDLLAGQSAHVKDLILILTGRGREQVSTLPHPLPPTINIYPDLSKALIGYLGL